MGRERATNPPLSISSEDEFVDRLLGGFGTFPSYFLRLPELNRRGPNPFDTIPALDRLSVDTVAEHVADGAFVVDVRPMASIDVVDAPGMAPTVIDVRQHNEYITGHIPAPSTWNSESLVTCRHRQGRSR